MTTPGRPQRNNADWFSHDADMRNDKKILAVRRKFGLEGYAVFCMVIETLTDCEFYRYEWNELGVELMASDFGIAPERLSEIMDYMTKKLHLFTLEEGFLVSKRHRERMEPLDKKRQYNRGANKPQNVISVTETPNSDNFSNRNSTNYEFLLQKPPENVISVTEKHHSKVKESKEEKRESQTRVRAKLSLSDCASLMEDPDVAELTDDITANALEFPASLRAWIDHLNHHNGKPPSKPMILTHLAILRDQTDKPCEVIAYSIGRGYPMLYPDFDDKPERAARSGHRTAPEPEPTPPYLRPFDENLARSRAASANRPA